MDARFVEENEIEIVKILDKGSYALVYSALCR